MAGNRSFDQEDVLVGEHFENLQFAHFHLVVPHVAAHAHPFHYLGSERRVAERTRCTEAVVLAVRLLHYTAEAVTPHNALEAFALRSAGDHYFVAFGKYIGDCNFVAEIFAEAHVAELLHFVERLFEACFFEMPHEGFGRVFCFAVAESQLEGRVAVVFFGAHLRYHAGASFDNSDCNVFAVVVIDAGHPDFFANQTVHCVLNFMVERLDMFVCGFRSLYCGSAPKKKRLEALSRVSVRSGSVTPKRAWYFETESRSENPKS